MRRRSQMRRQRSMGGQMAQNVPIPMPVQGLFAEARTSEIPGIFAGRLTNWRSNGTAIETRPQVSYRDTFNTARQRIPFEFNGLSAVISLQDAGASARDWTSGRGTVLAELTRTFPGLVSVDYLSSNLVMADGAGAPVLFNGSAFSAGAFTTATDKDVNEFDGVVAHHDRLYFWDTDGALEFYYGGIGAITGALVQFPLSRLGNITGSVSSMLSLTVDAGEGLDDVLCIITTTGQMVLYEGLDPGDANDWRLVSRIRATPPVSPRAFAQVGSDIWMLAGTGIVSVLDTIARGSAALVSQISAAISDDIIRAVEGGAYDWQLHVAADGNQVILNANDGVAPIQWVYYADSQSWATSDYPAVDWYNLGTETRFTSLVGYDGRINRLTDTAGEVVTATWHTSWFRTSARSVIYLEPTIIATSPLELKVTVLADHDETAADIAAAEQVVTIQPDGPADAGGTVALNDLIAVDAVGSVFQVRMEVTASWAKIVAMTVRVG